MRRHVWALALLGPLGLASPAWAIAPSPSPLPINGVTVDLQQSNPYKRGMAGGHVERPPFMSHGDGGGHHAVAAPGAHRVAPSPGPHGHHGLGHAHPGPSPTPTPRR